MLSKITERLLTNQKHIYLKRNISVLSSLMNSNGNDEPKDAKKSQDTPKAAVSNESMENELKVLKEKQQKHDELMADAKDKYMRALAEAENTRRRMTKQVDEAKIFGIQGFCKDLLEVSDILNLAITNTDINKILQSNNDTNSDQSKLVKEQVKAMFDGLKLTETKLIKIFEKHGLHRVQPSKGDKFDPTVHEALFQAPIPNQESGTILEIVQVGYKLQERVIRAAKVGVVQ